MLGAGEPCAMRERRVEAHHAISHLENDTRGIQSAAASKASVEVLLTCRRRARACIPPCPGAPTAKPWTGSSLQQRI